MRIQLGTRLNGPPGPKYRSTLRFCEFELRAGLPKPTKLRGWCDPDDHGALDASLVAPVELIFDEQGRPYTNDNRAPFDRLASACEALGASYLVLETGSRLSPSMRDRERFFSYCETLAATPGCPALVWRAGGLWEAEEVAKVCQARNLWACIDPFADELPALPHVYLQARAEGGTRRFGEDHFVRFIGRLQSNDALEHVVIAIDSDRSFRETSRLKALLEEFGLLEPR